LVLGVGGRQEPTLLNVTAMQNPLFEHDRPHAPQLAGSCVWSTQRPRQHWPIEPNAQTPPELPAGHTSGMHLLD